MVTSLTQQQRMPRVFRCGNVAPTCSQRPPVRFLDTHAYRAIDSFQILTAFQSEPASNARRSVWGDMWLPHTASWQGAEGSRNGAAHP